MTAQTWTPTVAADLGTLDLASEQSSVLDLIDKLRFAQLDNVKLPQIIAVGDQSSGKSSVLEAITGYAFPRNADACTRFPTEIRLRRGKEGPTSIYILPDKKTRSPAEQERLRRFHATLDASNSLSDVIERAIDEIAPKRIPGRFAAADTLVVEKTGPDLPLLTVVDLPGLVRIKNNDQSPEDIQAIETITDRYMRSRRAIILAVVGGNQDYTQAAVLQKARDEDPNGERTIGVLTKPDLTGTVGLEDKFIALVNNQDKYYKFDLGWYVLRNSSPRKLGEDWPSAEERQLVEDSFFSNGKWSTLPRDRCGATALKQKLSVQLQRHIGRYIPKLQKDIQKEYSRCLAELKELGDGRDTVHEMKGELLRLCSASRELVKAGVGGIYTNHGSKPFFPKEIDKRAIPPQKLRARVVEENKIFAGLMESEGPKKFFSQDTEAPVPVLTGTRLPSKHDYAKNELELYIQQNRGVELFGDHSPLLAYWLFQSLSQEWPGLTQMHKDTMGVICTQFLRKILDHLWPRPMREPLLRELIDPQMKKLLEEAQSEVDRLEQDRNLEIALYNPEYEIRLQQWYAKQPLDRPYSQEEVLLEKSIIYYELYEKIFVQNVVTQVVERHLLQALQGIFSELHIHDMPDETVEAIAAENKETREARKALKAKKLQLEESRDLCARLALERGLRTFGRGALSESDDSDDDDSSSRRDARARTLHPNSALHRKGVSSHQPLHTSSQPSQDGRQPQRAPSHSSLDEERRSNSSNTPSSSTDASVNRRSLGDGTGMGLAPAPTPAPNVPQRPPKNPVSPQGIPGGWDNSQPSDYAPQVGQAPVYSPASPAPPPPPTMGTGQFQSDRPQWPMSPPDSSGRPSSGSYPQHNGNAARMPLYEVNTPAPKPPKKFFGSRS